MLPDTAPCAIGLDVGGTKIAAGIVEFPMGRLWVKRLIPTRPERGGVAVMEDALALTRELLQEARLNHLTVHGIGIGICELVDLQGNVTSDHTVAWKGLAVQAEFARYAPTVVEADVRAHALAEALFGAGRGWRLFIFVTVGTGISACLVQEGMPFAGARGNALVLATGSLSFVCAHCGQSNDFVLEDVASGPALAARYGASRAEEVLEAANDGDPRAIKLVRDAGAALGNAVAWMANVLDPQAIVVGGGLGLAGGLYWKSFVAACREHIWSPETRTLPIVPAVIGAEAGIIGAAAAIAKQRGII